MTFFRFCGLMNLVFDATDEGVGFSLEAADGEGVPWPCLVFVFFFFDDAFGGPAAAAAALFFSFAMMAGREVQRTLSAR